MLLHVEVAHTFVLDQQLALSCQLAPQCIHPTQLLLARELNARQLVDQVAAQLQLAAQLLDLGSAVVAIPLLRWVM